MFDPPGDESVRVREIDTVIQHIGVEHVQQQTETKIRTLIVPRTLEVQHWFSQLKQVLITKDYASTVQQC